ncbi:hypothetical protein AGABI1DRAFT_91394 [Agaricus bisporus var. burnettii JB137-S8]|uniref:Sister chromatid cohesion protein DCC1 n=1 Tax=Agaricus bisporus var. burnettii (strain JB137-S8 / ATCC MYA-4627 / FGSC 10392) TaxID=597362 RepID=K5W035_AGABU|nr:uncharacterized protein AGABI1DRAFT_91394 [Agaricus bisporus var. burnettii JB137-S8]EKM80114.1 hypothetical protein AGABI1DRAFT_91394 [Agaricus bisporus var. burnettii JB137-S8]
MPSYDLCFSAHADVESASFKLLELTPELAELLEEAAKSLTTVTFAIKGRTGEDAVLCTTDKTYSLRSVALSNSVLVVTPPSSGSSISTTSGREPVVIRDELHEILEISPSVPKLHGLISQLRGKEYDESDEVEDNASHSDDAKTDVQASDEELDRGLKERRVLVINGFLRPISKDYLKTLLELVLNLLASLSLRSDNIPLDDLVSSLAQDHEVPRAVSMQLLAWFGDVDEAQGSWTMDVQAVVKEVGIGLMRHHRRDPIRKDAFLAQWKATVGDTFNPSVDLSLLTGNYLVSTAGEQENLVYFPSTELPVDPAQRLADLFRQRTRWTGDDIMPFLSEIAVGPKERDKLLLKYCRVITDPQGVWYTSRTQYTG